ncbi:MAG TPA: MFS transporter [Acidimicrobiales bacterium]|nr:MFS transporter [Acidimicrobiales bacterium]
MSVTAAGSVERPTGLSWLWKRQLNSYPETAQRTTYLGITVLCTVMLYYELYVGGSVSTLFLTKLHMSFSFLVYTLAIGNLLGAFGSLFAGLTDRLGRTNLVVIGLLLTGIFTAFVIPASTNKWEFTIFGFIVGIVEGICLVATPALIRDFSPQVGRGTAMGFWTSGPVLGSLAVAVVGSSTIPSTISPAHNPGFWTHEYLICGIAGLVVWAIALLGLKELSPGLRDQLMVTMHDRALIEARAKDIDIEASLRNPWRQLLRPDIVVSALGISIFLLVYYTAVGFGLIYFTTVFGYTVTTGNHLGDWNWGVNVAAVILFGIISDRFRVRKPFMIVGGVAAAVMMVLYLEQAGKPTSFLHLAILVSLLSFALGVAYVPWMASFTETIEDRNPALTATGLAIWGWIIRIVVFVSYLILPVVIHSVTPLVTYGTSLQQVVKQYPAQVQTLSVIHPDTLAILQKNPTNGTADVQAIQQISAALHISPTQATQRLIAAGALPASAKAVLTHATSVQNAAKEAPNQWKNWYWVCFGGMIFFLGTVPLMRGRWSPKQARADERAHEAMVEAELAKLHAPA